MNIIIFNNEDAVCAMFPVLESGFNVDDIAKKDVPQGVNYFIMDSDSLPDAPQETWRLSNGIVTVDSEVLNIYRIKEAERQCSLLTSVAAQSIIPLQYAADLDEATNAETLLINKWKKYIVDLNRIDLSLAPDISWPEVPII